MKHIHRLSKFIFIFCWIFSSYSEEPSKLECNLMLEQYINPSRCVVVPILKSKLILLRHLRTNFNEDYEKAAEENNKLKALDIRCDKKYIDSDVFKSSKEDLIRAEEIKKYNIQKIYVSPTLRTVLTLLEVLKIIEQSQSEIVPEVKVLPLLFEKIEDSCDIISNLNQRIVDYNSFSFRNKTYKIDWTEFNSSVQNQIYQLKYMRNLFSDNNISFYNQALDLINTNNISSIYDDSLLTSQILDNIRKLSEKGEYIEDFSSVNQRLLHVKHQIYAENKENWDDKKSKILVIGHSVLFRYWYSKYVKSYETYEPIYSHNKLFNCEIKGVDFEI